MHLGAFVFNSKGDFTRIIVSFHITNQGSLPWLYINLTFANVATRTMSNYRWASIFLLIMYFTSIIFCSYEKDVTFFQILYEIIAPWLSAPFLALLL